jgi:hypothetical protein
VGRAREVRSDGEDGRGEGGARQHDNRRRRDATINRRRRDKVVA